MAEPPNIPPQVIQAVQQGNLIEAIKYLRQHKPQLGLAEAKALIEAIQRQGNVPPVVQRAEAKVAAKIAAKGATVHAHHHAPPIPHSMMDPNVSPGEVPRHGGSTGFLFVLVAIVVVIAFAVYMGR